MHRSTVAEKWLILFNAVCCLLLETVTGTMYSVIKGSNTLSSHYLLSTLLDYMNASREWSKLEVDTCCTIIWSVNMDTLDLNCFVFIKCEYESNNMKSSDNLYSSIDILLLCRTFVSYLGRIFTTVFLWFCIVYNFCCILFSWTCLWQQQQQVCYLRTVWIKIEFDQLIMWAGPFLFHALRALTNLKLDHSE